MKTETVQDVVAGRTLGELMAAGAVEFAEDLANRVKISAKYNIHNVEWPEELPPFTPSEAVNARAALSASQPVFAAFLGASSNAVKAWEQGAVSPNKIARRMFHFIRRDPTYWRNVFDQEMSGGTPKKESVPKPALGEPKMGLKRGSQRQQASKKAGGLINKKVQKKKTTKATSK